MTVTHQHYDIETSVFPTRFRKSEDTW